MTERMERHQVALYAFAVLVGGIAGLLFPGANGPVGAAVSPLLALLLTVTFLAVPFDRLGGAFRDTRFFAGILVLNVVVVPVVVWVLSRIVAHDHALLLGVVLVLVAPCVDYVIVFTGLAGGAKDRLLAATPLLMLVQMIMIPLFLVWFTGAELRIDFAPFAEAFLLLIVVPLIVAAAVQRLLPQWARRLQTAMVPLMMLTLAAVVASQLSAALSRISALLLVVPVFVLFAAVMLACGIGVQRVAGVDAPGGRAIVFSGITRNSLVVLPLALAMPFDLTPLVVVLQTLVELLILLLCVRLVPLFVPAD